MVDADAKLNETLRALFSPLKGEIDSTTEGIIHQVIAPLLERIVALEDRVAGLEHREIQGPTNSE
jgi:hypothetical protein